MILRSGGGKNLDQGETSQAKDGHLKGLEQPTETTDTGEGGNMATENKGENPQNNIKWLSRINQDYQ